MKPASNIGKWRIGKWGLPAVLICGLVGFFFATGLHALISWETVTRHYAEISHFLEQNHTASYFGFIIIYTAVVAFSLPIASLLTPAAGALIGWPAIGLIVLAATAGASLLFIAARGLLRDVLRARAGPFFAKLESGFTKNAFAYLLFLRLMPAAPFWAVNILPAFSGMRFVQFVSATAIGITPAHRYMWLWGAVLTICLYGAKRLIWQYYIARTSGCPLQDWHCWPCFQSSFARSGRPVN